MMHDLWYRLRALGRRTAAESELDDELRFHLERETENLRAGLSAKQRGGGRASSSAASIR